MLRKALDDAAMAASKKQVEYKKPLAKKDLAEHVDVIRGAVMIAYPMARVAAAASHHPFTRTQYTHQ
jgi:hypothetical protein